MSRVVFSCFYLLNVIHVKKIDNGCGLLASVLVEWYDMISG